jgi:hypothetical protein
VVFLLADHEASARMQARWIYPLALMVALAHLSGCSETLSLSQLPDLAKLQQKVLNKDEQKGKVNDMIERRDRHEAEAAREIERGR